MSTVSITNVGSFISDLVFDDGLTQQTFTDAVEFREDNTPIVTGITPDSGDVFGGYDITISGSYLDIDTPAVSIDGVDCAVIAFT